MKIFILVKKELHFSCLNILLFLTAGWVLCLAVGFNRPRFMWFVFCTAALYVQPLFFESLEIRNRTLRVFKALPVSSSQFFLARLFANLLNIAWFYLIPVLLLTILHIFFHTTFQPALTPGTLVTHLSLLVFFAVFFSVMVSNSVFLFFRVAMNVLSFGVMIMIFTHPAELFRLFQNLGSNTRESFSSIPVMVFLNLASLILAELGRQAFIRQSIYRRLQ